MDWETAAGLFRKILALRPVISESAFLRSSNHGETFDVFVTRACMDQRELRPLLALADEHGFELTWMGNGARLWKNPYA